MEKEDGDWVRFCARDGWYEHLLIPQNTHKLLKTVAHTSEVQAMYHRQIMGKVSP